MRVDVRGVRVQLGDAPYAISLDRERDVELAATESASHLPDDRVLDERYAVLDSDLVEIDLSQTVLDLARELIQLEALVVMSDGMPGDPLTQPAHDASRSSPIRESGG